MNTFVCKINRDQVEWISVRKGQIMGDLIEIFGNIQEGDVLAKNGSEELVNHSKVRTTVQNLSGTTL